MKTTFKTIIICAVLAVIASACNLHTYSNGDLDGYWQMTAMDSLSSGKSKDMIQERIFWAVDRKLLRTRDIKNVHRNVFFRFAQTDKTLELSDPYYSVGSSTDSTTQDPKLTDVKDVQPFGINAIPEKFSIEQLDDNEMVLKSSTLRLHFIKF